MIKQFVMWGNLDYLLVDTPSDEHISTIEVNPDGAMVVNHTSDMVVMASVAGLIPIPLCLQAVSSLSIM